jgi:two-component system sensor histidine kinase KdpD
LALVGDGRSGETVVRHAKRLAEALHASLVALHVEQPGAALEGGSAMALAAQLDAELEAIVGRDVVAAALALAQKRNVTQIVVGRTTHALWRRLLRRSLSQQLLSRAPEFALHVVPLARDLERTGRAREKPKPPIFAWAVAAVLVCAVIGLGEGLRGILDHEALGMVFLAAVVGSASLYGLPVGLFAAALGFVSWNFFFIPPVYHFSIYAPRDIIAILVFAGVAAATGVLASRVRAEARVAQARIEGLRRIAGFSRRLGAPTTEPDLLDEIARQAAGVAGAAVVLTQMGEDLNIRAAEPPADTMDDAGWAAARWAYGRGDPTGNGTGTLPSSRWRFQPMKTLRGNVGVLGVRSERSLDAPALQAIATLADQAAVAVERVRLANEFARSAAHAETQRLRTALLSSLSHDLRTPLTGIRGAAETLRTSWSSLDDSTRQDLLRSIEDDTERMTRFLSNIMEMTRLESGAITPRRVAVELAEVVDAAIARTPGSPEVFVTLPPGQTVVADPTLLEQVLVNILDNAVKYAPAGSPITVSAEQAQNGLTLRIADQGYGISEADLPHIFDSFYRATRGDRTAPGTGLGLAIARGLIEAMGGAIDAMSPKPEGGAGTVIVLRIPRP